MNKSKARSRTVRPITPAQFIIQHLLRMQRDDFGKAIGVSGSVAARYDVIPEKHRKRVIRLSVDRGVLIRPSWFEAVPWGPGVPR